jgi:hypothetical protein
MHRCPNPSSGALVVKKSTRFRLEPKHECVVLGYTEVETLQQLKALQCSRLATIYHNAGISPTAYHTRSEPRHMCSSPF